ncbi:MAG TPA: hypothetical protein VEZ19_06525 [Rubrobacter sp.]|jgi:hypothetical protein|nr:hypothetical protein [Rubrobacter sp.]
MLRPQKYSFDREPYSGTSKIAAFRKAAREAGPEPFFPDLAVTFPRLGRGPATLGKEWGFSAWLPRTAQP